MWIYLDDVRPIPDGYVGCRTADEAIKHIRSGKVKLISFDHDLGTDATGYDVAKLIEELVFNKKIKMPQYLIHSANPVGVKRIQQAMESTQRFS